MVWRACASCPGWIPASCSAGAGDTFEAVAVLPGPDPVLVDAAPILERAGDCRGGVGSTVAAGDAAVPIHRTYRLDEITTAHADMEAGRATGKLVVGSYAQTVMPPPQPGEYTLKVEPVP